MGLPLTPFPICLYVWVYYLIISSPFRVSEYLLCSLLLCLPRVWCLANLSVYHVLCCVFMFFYGTPIYRWPMWNFEFLVYLSEKPWSLFSKHSPCVKVWQEKKRKSLTTCILPTGCFAIAASFCAQPRHFFAQKPRQLGSGQAVPRLTHLAKLVLTLLLSILDLPKMLVSYIVNSQSLEDA